MVFINGLSIKMSSWTLGLNKNTIDRSIDKIIDSRSPCNTFPVWSLWPAHAHMWKSDLDSSYVYSWSRNQISPGEIKFLWSFSDYRNQFSVYLICKQSDYCWKTTVKLQCVQKLTSSVNTPNPLSLFLSCVLVGWLETSRPALWTMKSVKPPLTFHTSARLRTSLLCALSESFSSVGNLLF